MFNTKDFSAAETIVLTAPYTADEAASNTVDGKVSGVVAYRLPEIVSLKYTEDFIDNLGVMLMGFPVRDDKIEYFVVGVAVDGLTLHIKVTVTL